MNLTLVTDSVQSDEPVQWGTAGSGGMRDYLRLDTDTDQSTVEPLIRAARRIAESHVCRELTPKTYELVLDNFPPFSDPSWAMYGYPTGASAAGLLDPYIQAPFSGEIRLLDPLASVTSVTYKDYTGALTALVENVDYVVDKLKHPGCIYPAYGVNWPGATLWPSSAVMITFVAGPAPVMEDWKLAIKRLVSQWYEQRVPFEAIRYVAEIPFDVTALLNHDKVYRF